MKLNFHVDVPGAAQTILREEYRAYTKTAAVTAAEQQALASWLAAGHSPYSNPYDLADESGRELDFVTAARLTSELASEMAAG